MRQDINLANKTALVSGASYGIGLATAQKLAEYGATVVLAARSQDKLKQAHEALKAEGLNSLFVSCDVSDYDSFQNAIEFAVMHTGSLDILINNAGVIEPLATLVDSDPLAWEKAVDINYKGVYFGMRAALPQMLKQAGGTIVNISSGAANSALVGWSHYCSSKAAAKKLTEVAHKELMGRNVNVVGLSPGTVATPMMQKIRDAKINPISHLDWNNHIPAEWVAEGVAFLCGEGGKQFAGTDFTLKTVEGRQLVGLPFEDVQG